MVPYIHIPNFGPIQPFGVILAIGVLFASWLTRRYAEKNNLSPDMMGWLGFRLIIIGFISCHVFNAIFYEPHRLREDPLLLLKVWDGISSWGGVVGGAAAFIYYIKKFKLDALRWADCVAVGVAGGWMFGRLACAIAHDHVGYPSTFFLAVNFPVSGKHAPVHVPSHDLGLYEFLMLIPITLLLVLLARRKQRKPGLLMGLLAVCYSVPRFFLDFLRLPKSDPRYFGLTFAQYCCILATLFGLYLLFVAKSRGPLTEEGSGRTAKI